MEAAGDVDFDEDGMRVYSEDEAEWTEASIQHAAYATFVVRNRGAVIVSVWTQMLTRRVSDSRA